MAKKLADSTGKSGTSKNGTGKNSTGENSPHENGTDKDPPGKEGLGKKSTELNEEFMVIDSDSVEFDSEEEAPPLRAPQKDPSIRRKIEDRLERKRLREELGIYDDEAWEGL